MRMEPEESWPELEGDWQRERDLLSKEVFILGLLLLLVALRWWLS